jgi:hypothetical protein
MARRFGVEAAGGTNCVNGDKLVKTWQIIGVSSSPAAG